jgi:hypothetical protein
MCERQQKTTDCFCPVNYNGIVRFATKGITGCSGFYETIRRQVHRCLLRAFVSRPRLDRDSQDSRIGRITGNEINACVINPGTLVAIFRKPVKNQCFGKVACDFRVPCAFLHLLSSLHDQQHEADPPFYLGGSSRKCTPGMGVNLWGASPLYGESSTVVRQGKPSTSRRQGRLREEGAGGNRSANL